MRRLFNGILYSTPAAEKKVPKNPIYAWTGPERPRSALETCAPASNSSQPHHTQARAASQAHLRTRLLLPGWYKMPVEAPEALRQRAQRILQAGEGSFAASGPPQAAEFITHRLLVAASEAVEAAAAAVQLALSDRIRYRLLARVVADAMCAPEPLVQALAEILGRRLATQAKRVRAAVAAIEERAEQARVDARATAGSSTATVPDGLPAIDAAEQEELTLQWSEIFENVDGLVAPVAPAAVAPAIVAPAVVAPAVVDAWAGCLPLPPRLAEALGEEGYIELRKLVGSDSDATLRDVTDFYLPLLVSKLLRERAREAVTMTELETEVEEMGEAVGHSDGKLRKMKLELVDSQSREDALGKVVRDVCRGQEPTDVMWLKVQPLRPSK